MINLYEVAVSGIKFAYSCFKGFVLVAEALSDISRRLSDISKLLAINGINTDNPITGTELGWFRNILALSVGSIDLEHGDVWLIPRYGYDQHINYPIIFAMSCDGFDTKELELNKYVNGHNNGSVLVKIDQLDLFINSIGVANTGYVYKNIKNVELEYKSFTLK